MKLSRMNGRDMEWKRTKIKHYVDNSNETIVDGWCLEGILDWGIYWSKRDRLYVIVDLTVGFAIGGVMNHERAKTVVLFLNGAVIREPNFGIDVTDPIGMNYIAKECEIVSIGNPITDREREIRNG